MAFFHDKDEAENLVFSSLHGENIKLSSRGKEAEWMKNHKSGICVSNRTIGDNETITLKYEGSGHFLLGLVYSFPNIPDTDVTQSHSLHWEYFRFRKSKDVITISRSFNQYLLTRTSLGRGDRAECLPEDANLYILICVYFGDLEIHIDTDTPFPVVFDNRHGSNIRLSHQQQQVSLHHYNPFAVCCIQKPLLLEQQIQIKLSPIDDANWFHCHIYLSNVGPDVIGLPNIKSITDNGDVSAKLVPFGSMIEENTSVKIALLKSGEIASNVNLNRRKNIPREIDIGLPIFVYIEIFRMKAFLQPVFWKECGDLCYSMSTTISPSPFRSECFYQTLPLCFSEPPPLTPINTMQIDNMSDRSRRDEGNICNHITRVKTLVNTTRNFDSGESCENGSNEETSRKQFDVGTQCFEESIPSRLEHSANSRRFGPNNDTNMLSAEGISMEQTFKKDFNIGRQHAVHNHDFNHITEVKTIAQSVVNYDSDSISDDDSSNDKTSRKDWDDEQQYAMPIDEDSDDYVDVNTEAGESVPTSDKDFEDSISSRLEHSAYSRRYGPINDTNMLSAEGISLEETLKKEFNVGLQHAVHNHDFNHITEVKTIAQSVVNYDSDSISDDDSSNDETSRKDWDDEQQYAMPIDKDSDDYVYVHTEAGESVPTADKDFEQTIYSRVEYSANSGSYGPNNDTNTLSAKSIPNEEMSTKDFNGTSPEKPESIQHGRQQTFPPIGRDLDVLMPSTLNCSRKPIPTPRKGSQQSFPLPDDVSCVPPIPPRSASRLHHLFPGDALCVPSIPPRSASRLHHPIPDNVSCVPSIQPRSVLRLQNPVPDDATCVPPIPPRNGSHMPSQPDDSQ